jgi:hypothetical protein
MKNEQLIKEYVKCILSEEDFGGSGGGVYGGYMNFGTPDDLYNTFVKPFTDVVQTTAGKTKQLSTNIQASLKVTVGSVIAAVVPFLELKTKEIFADEKQRLASIENEYAAVYKANFDALKTADAKMFTFLLDPAKYLVPRVIKTSYKTTRQLLDVLSGGKILSKHSPEKQKTQKESKTIEISQLLVEKKVSFEDAVNIALSSDYAQKMMKTAKKSLIMTLDDIIKPVVTVYKSNSIDDIKGMIDEKGLKKLNIDDINKSFSQIKSALLNMVKTTSAELIKSRIEGAKKDGIPPDNAYFKIHDEYLKKLDSIKV